jgi:hypothetical protein
MFISEDEANRRLNTSENVLTRVSGGDVRVGIEPPPAQEPPVIIPDEILDSEDGDCASASAIGLAPSGSALKRMLGLPRGKKPGVGNMDPVIRAATATCAQMGRGMTQVAANVFETSLHHADELKHGFTNQAARYGGAAPNDGLLKEIARQKGQVRDLAFQKLTKTLGLISDDKIEAITDAVKLGRLAKDLSAVHDKAMPREEKELNGGGVHFHIWKPEMKAEADYETVTVGAVGR